MPNRTIGTGGLVMMLVLALAAVGIGVALWSKVLTINGIVGTGSVNAEFVAAFTDDDDRVNDPDRDFYDTGDCPIHAGPLPAPTSCDPKETGAEPEANRNHRYDKDVARCDATAVTNDNEPQPGSQLANVAIRNSYPSYHCTAWFGIHNNGSIPIHLHSVSIAGKAARLCQVGTTAYDLDGDGRPDVEICLSGLQPCTAGACPELQIHPSQTFFVDLDMHIMQTANQNAVYTFTAAMCFHQWNEEIGVCPASCGGGTVDLCVDGDGIATAGPGAFTVAVGDPLLSAAALGNPAGLDLIDRGVVNGVYNAGDDLMVEDPNGTPTCPTAARNAVYDANAAAKDCVVLDPDGGLADGDFVTCDTGAGCGLSFRDDDLDGRYDVGEDLVVDVNNNGVFD